MIEISGCDSLKLNQLFYQHYSLYDANAKSTNKCIRSTHFPDIHCFCDSRHKFHLDSLHQSNQLFSNVPSSFHRPMLNEILVAPMSTKITLPPLIVYIQQSQMITTSSSLILTGYTSECVMDDKCINIPSLRATWLTKRALRLKNGELGNYIK
ncbi:hypothetical protein WN51_04352 [Melipona quadrifasciata]|uniref:Uncharacterized protein n=1 Tax=Melipona quadrifasciata TaxID=166423 RepID=A0A0M8ZQY3_9HYME|nr:hypothetical protein WN51_04352 [Melipona quadrifasciata]